MHVVVSPRGSLNQLSLFEKSTNEQGRYLVNYSIGWAATMISEDEALEKAFDLHPELKSWKNADYERAETQSGVNWRLHLDMDAVVLRRASDDSLPDDQVIRELERRGESRAAAVHQIALLVAEDLWGRMKEAEARGSKELSADAGWSQRRNEKLNDRITALTELGTNIKD